MTEKQQETIKQSEINPNFKHEISEMPGGEKLMRCFQCGTCTSDCPIARFSDNYRPRQIIRMTQLGLRERVLRSDTLWLCAACFTCSDRCPQDVEVANVIRVLRNIAAREGYMPKVFTEQFTSILESGYAYRIPELRLKKREVQGLPPLPKGNSVSIKTTLEKVHFPKQSEKEGE
jgi:heterodisulfide reductase subunit C